MDHNLMARKEALEPTPPPLVHSEAEKKDKKKKKNQTRKAAKEPHTAPKEFCEGSSSKELSSTSRPSLAISHDVGGLSESMIRLNGQVAVTATTTAAPLLPQPLGLGSSPSMSRLKQIERSTRATDKNTPVSFDTAAIEGVAAPAPRQRSTATTGISDVDAVVSWQRLKSPATRGTPTGRALWWRFHRRHPSSLPPDINSKDIQQVKQRWQSRRANIAVEIEGVAPTEKRSRRQGQDEDAARFQWQEEDDNGFHGPGAFAVDGPGHDEDDDDNSVLREFRNHCRNQNADEGRCIEAQVQSIKNSTPVRGSRRIVYATAIVAAVVVISVVLITAVVVTQGEEKSDLVGSSPTLAPTGAPTSDPWAECFGDTGDFMALNLNMRTRDLNVFADISLCPGSKIHVSPGLSQQPLMGFGPPLNLQSNMRIRCGSNGALSNQCIVSGDLEAAGVLVINSEKTSEEQAARNVTIEGITFEDATGHLLQLFNGGDIIFRNCVFRSTRSHIPVLVNYTAATDNLQIRQHVTFDGCIFTDLKYGPDAPSTEIASVVQSDNPANTIIFRECVFRELRAAQQFPGYVITSRGAEVEVERSCFYGVDDTAVSPILLTEEYGSPSFIGGQDNFVDGKWACDFVSEQRADELDTTCREPSVTSPFCLAPNMNVSITW